MNIRAAQSLFLFCILAARSYGQSQEPPKHDTTRHPKLGLVLEGGHRSEMPVLQEVALVRVESEGG